MRFFGMALISSAVVVSACGGVESTAHAAVAESAPGATGVAHATAGAVPTVPAAPITGTLIEVKMIGDAQGYRFEPSEITAAPGDGVKFVMISGGPHNVAFQASDIPADVRAQLDANFGDAKMAELTSNLMMNANDTFVLSLGGIKPGKYSFVCTPHLAMGMKGVITVQ